MYLAPTCANCAPRSLEQLLEVRNARIDQAVHRYCTIISERLEKQVAKGSDPEVFFDIYRSDWDGNQERTEAIAKRVAQHFAAQGFRANTKVSMEWFPPGKLMKEGFFSTRGTTVMVDMPVRSEDVSDSLSGRDRGSLITQAPTEGQFQTKHALSAPKIKGALSAR